MAYAVKMPQMGLAGGSCILASWQKKKGDSVKVGDELFSIETDKTSFTVESEFEGQMLELFFNDGDEVEVMTTVCVIGQEGEDISDFCPVKTREQPLPEETKNIDTKHVEEKQLEKKSPVQVRQQAELKISPRAKAAAEKYNVDYRMATPTGPDRRIIERDIVRLTEEGSKFTKAATYADYDLAKAMNIRGTGIGGRITIADLATDGREPPEETAVVKADQESGFRVEKFSNIRKIIAKNMKLSLSTIPQLTYNASFDATEIMGLRAKLKAHNGDMAIGDITINDLILFAVSRTLPKYKYLNAHMEEDANSIKLFENVHLGVAVDTERGLMVPTVFNANKMTVAEISRQTKKMIEECRKGTIAPELLRGGTFTVSNVGSIGLESFTPIINPPQTGILGVSGITYKTKLVDEKYVTYPAMGLSLTCDHRAIDGAPSARFLKDLINNLENITLLMIM
jgi:pyruvate dehydrogenase E2 component (dihydrolipoamide acetyltransferase)